MNVGAVDLAIVVAYVAAMIAVRALDRARGAQDARRLLRSAAGTFPWWVDPGLDRRHRDQHGHLPDDSGLRLRPRPHLAPDRARLPAPAGSLVVALDAAAVLPRHLLHLLRGARRTASAARRSRRPRCSSSSPAAWPTACGSSSPSLVLAGDDRHPDPLGGAGVGVVTIVYTYVGGMQGRCCGPSSRSSSSTSAARSSRSRSCSSASPAAGRRARRGGRGRQAPRLRLQPRSRASRTPSGPGCSAASSSPSARTASTSSWCSATSAREGLRDARKAARRGRLRRRRPVRASSCSSASPSGPSTRRTRSAPAVSIAATDRVFARFILDELPVGVVGLLLGAIFAAAMSSSLNSCATAAVRDLQRPWTGDLLSPERELRLTRLPDRRLRRGADRRRHRRPVAHVVGRRERPRASPPSPPASCSASSSSACSRRASASAPRSPGSSSASSAMTAIYFATALAWPWYALVGSAITFATGWLASHAWPRESPVRRPGLQ